MLALSVIIMYMKKFLHSDWLRAVQFFFKQCRKELIQCKKRKQIKQARPQVALTPRARAILLVFEKFTRAYLFKIALEIM